MIKMHFVSAHFGGKPPWPLHIKSKSKSVEVSTAYYTDANTASRHLAMHPRLKAKVPKMLEWQSVDADWYIWMDSSSRITANDPASIILDTAGNKKLCLFNAFPRQSILEECNVVRQCLQNNHEYQSNRYKGEPILDQLIHYYGDKKFTDNKLFAMTFFAYHHSVSDLMQAWFIENVRWSIQDQISFPYVLNSSGLDYSLFEGQINGSNALFEWDWQQRDKSLDSSLPLD